MLISTATVLSWKSNKEQVRMELGEQFSVSHLFNFGIPIGSLQVLFLLIIISILYI